MQLENILNVYVDMTRYMDGGQLIMANSLFNKLRECRGMEDLIRFLETKCEELNVDQFGEVKDTQSLYLKK